MFFTEALRAFDQSKPSTEVANLRGAIVTKTGSVISQHFPKLFYCFW